MINNQDKIENHEESYFFKNIFPYLDIATQKKCLNEIKKEINEILDEEYIDKNTKTR